MDNRSSTIVYQQDGISLVDIWQTLAQYRKLILVIWALVSLGGAIVAALMPERYAFTTLVEIGNYAGGKTELVETSVAARTSLLVNIISVLQRKHLSEGKDAPAFDVKISIPEKSPSILLLETRGSDESAPSHLAFLGEIVERLKQEHEVAVAATREALTIQREDIKRSIAALANARAVTIARYKILDEEEGFLKRQLEQSLRITTLARQDDTLSTSRTMDEATLLTHMMVTNQLEQHRRTLAALEERLLLRLPQERKDVSKTLADYKLALDEKRSALSAVASNLRRIRETRTLWPPSQSPKPVAPNRGAIVALAVMGGLMLGVLVAFVMWRIGDPRGALDRTGEAGGRRAL